MDFKTYIRVDVQKNCLPVYWKDKPPLFYVRRYNRDGYITGYLTAQRNWAGVSRAHGCLTAQEACDAAMRSGCHSFDVLQNVQRPAAKSTFYPQSNQTFSA